MMPKFSDRTGAAALVVVIISMIVTGSLIAGGLAIYELYFKVPEPQVTLEIVPPSRVLVGEPVSVQVSYANNSDKILHNASLAFRIPADVEFLGEASDKRVQEETIGDVGPGSINQRTFDLIVIGGEQSLRRLEASLRYTVGDGSQSSFEKKDNVDLSVDSYAVALNFEGPEKVLSGEEFELTLRYENTSGKEARGTKLSLAYPPIFKFLSGTIAPSKTPDTWDFGTLAPGAKGELVIKGTVLGMQESFFSVNAKLTAMFSGETYTLNEKSVSVGIAVAPLALNIQVNENDQYIAKLKDRLHYTLRYRNNSNATLHNAVITASLSGTMYNFMSLFTSGAFNSIKNVITWNAGNIPALGTILPGAEGEVSFDVEVKNTFPIKKLSDKDYSLKVQASIESPTVPPGVTAPKTISLTGNEVKVAGEIALGTSAYFFEPTYQIVNRGPYPPRVNQPTQYTVHWKLTNYATDMSGVKVSAFLQSGARFTNIMKSTVETQPQYNAASGEITWEIPLLAATKGLIGGPIEAVFQIELTPAINQVGQYVTFLGPTRLTAHDVFVDRDVERTGSALTTELRNDLRVTAGDRRVRQ